MNMHLTRIRTKINIININKFVGWATQTEAQIFSPSLTPTHNKNIHKMLSWTVTPLDT